MSIKNVAVKIQKNDLNDLKKGLTNILKIAPGLPMKGGGEGCQPKRRPRRTSRGRPYKTLAMEKREGLKTYQYLPRGVKNCQKGGGGL